MEFKRIGFSVLDGKIVQEIDGGGYVDLKSISVTLLATRSKTVPHKTYKDINKTHSQGLVTHSQGLVIVDGEIYEMSFLSQAGYNFLFNEANGLLPLLQLLTMWTDQPISDYKASVAVTDKEHIIKNIWGYSLRAKTFIPLSDEEIAANAALLSPDEIGEWVNEWNNKGGDQ